MAATTLNQVVQLASRLPGEDKEVLIELLRRQRAEEWREQLARSARKAEGDFQAGKLRAEVY